MQKETPHKGGETVELSNSYILPDDLRHPSQLAYEKAITNTGMVYGAVITLLTEHGPLTHDQLYRHYLDAGYPLKSRQRVATVCAALVKTGRVVEAGRGLSDMGNTATLWEVKQ